MRTTDIPASFVDSLWSTRPRQGDADRLRSRPINGQAQRVSRSPWVFGVASSPSRAGSCLFVFVVAADPELEPVSFIAAFGRAVEDPVVAHQELDAAAGGRVGLVD